MTMIEVVARAIESAAYNADDTDQEYPMKSEAKAAIKAMRNPSETMEEAGGIAATKGPQDGVEITIYPKKTWQAMIDEALKDD